MAIPILYIIDYIWLLAGSEKHLFDLLSHIDKNKFKPFVIAFLGTMENKERIEKLGIPVQILNINKIYGKRQLRLLFELRKFIKENNIKIVQTYHTNADIYGTLLAKLSGVPIIISSRRDMGFNRNKRHILCYKFLNNYTTKIICVSEAIKRLVIKEEGASEEKIEVIYNGITQEQFDKKIDVNYERNKFGFSPHEPIVGMLANFGFIKGHKYFLEAAVLIKNKIKNVQFVLAGGGLREDQVKQNVVDLGLEDCVHFVGHRSDIPEFLSILDILVVPSLSEGFSNTIIEGLYMKRPIVATSVGGNPEIIHDNVTGILVPPANSIEIYKGVVKLLNNKGFSIKLGENGKKLVERRFMLEKMIRETEAVYNDLLEKKGVRYG